MFTEPHWLLLLIPALLGAYVYRPLSNRLFALRILFITTVVLALAGPVINLPVGNGAVIVVADRSFSMPRGIDNSIAETVNILRKGMPENADLGIISFGTEAKIELAASKSSFSGFTSDLNRSGSNLNEGISRALSLISSDASGRILLLSDNRYSGESPMSSALRAATRGIPIDYRLFDRDLSNDTAITSFASPGLLSPNESFLLKSRVFSPIAQKAEILLYASDKFLGRYNKELSSGYNNLIFNMTAPESSVVKYKMILKPEFKDSVPENNEAVAICEVIGKKPILVVTESESSAVARLLNKAKVSNVVQSPRNIEWTIEFLAGYSALILENVSADRLTLHGMQLMAAWVKHFGGGLMLTGGKNAFGSGGYFQSPLEEAFPVSMELRSEHRKMKMALMIVLDRSGSMTAPTRGGRTKMDLANISSAGVLEMLTPEDYLGVLAVDTAPHEVFPLQKIAGSADYMRSKIMSIESMGGGIYVYDGISNAVDKLLKTDVKVRHIILFADANDAEKPGEYWELLDHATKAGLTLSVIGLGTETDSDAEILRKVANAGKGRIFFTREPEELPRLFLQDTFVAAKSTYIEEPTELKLFGTYKELLPYKNNLSENIGLIGAYNLCYEKPASTVVLKTADENKSPILSYWQYGLGKTACLATPLEGDGAMTSSGVLTKQEMLEMTVSLCEMISNDDREKILNLPILQSIENGYWAAAIHLDPERDKEPFKSDPLIEVLRMNENNEQTFETIKMRRDTADSFSGGLTLKGNEVIAAMVKVDGHVKRLHPICQPYAAEYVHDSVSDKKNILKQIADVTGGKEVINLANIWETIPIKKQKKELSFELLIAALFIFLIEIAERRLSLMTAVIKNVIRKKGKKTALNVTADKNVEVKKNANAVSKMPSLTSNQSSQEKLDEEKKDSSLSSIFKKAKNNAGKRT